MIGVILIIGLPLLLLLLALAGVTVRLKHVRRQQRLSEQSRMPLLSCRCWRQLTLQYYLRRKQSLRCALIIVYHRQHRLEAKQRKINDRIITLMKQRRPRRYPQA